MRYLGIDVGRKRIGLALSDKNGLMAFPYQAIVRHLHGDEGVMKIIKEITDKEGVSRVVAGLPLNLKGEPTKETEEVRSFIERLQRHIPQPIIFTNEMFSTKLAQRSGNERVDEKAACLILQGYLDTQQK